MYDVAILGAGPAGCAAAVSLARLDPDLRVAVVSEPTSVPRIQTLAPGIQRLLEQLGLWDSFREQRFEPCYGTSAVWGNAVAYEHNFLFGMLGHGWYADRVAFERWLSSSLPPRVDRYPARFLHATPCWRLETSLGSLDAGYVIDATGRNGVFARIAGARRRSWDTLTAVRARAEMEEPARVWPVLVEAEQVGWWCSARQQTHSELVFYSDADIIRRQRLRSGSRLEGPPARCAVLHQRLGDTAHSVVALDSAATQCLHPLQGSRWLVAGDAACAFDPLSSAGVVHALRSGMLAAFATLDYLRGRTAGPARYAHLMETGFQQFLHLRQYYYGREVRWGHAPFWERRHAPVLPPAAPNGRLPHGDLLERGA